MMTLKILSALLSYPNDELRQALPELRAILAQEEGLPSSARVALGRLMDEIASGDVYAAQERYVSLFDRGRALSLYLFEHVHGESRDRGQAMVELAEVYRHNGYELAARELPDYVPLFLEFLAQIPMEEAQELLAGAMPVLSLVGARLVQRESAYSAVFEALEAIAGAPEELTAIRRQAAEEGPDQTLVQMDRIWEEEAVTFLDSSAPCGTDPGAAQPVRWVSDSGNRSETHSAQSGGY